jgi:hypothetical protein
MTAPRMMKEDLSKAAIVGHDPQSMAPNTGCRIGSGMTALRFHVNGAGAPL